jgi:cobalt-zinc-cadmium efflux system membrane fusion protein
MKMRHALLLASLFGGACSENPDSYSHSDDHPKGHDHHAEGHGHGDGPVSIMTLWSDEFELFAESHGAEVGKPVSMLIHLTVLDGFLPLTDSELVLELDGPAQLSASTKTAFRPGIFQLTINPKVAGHYKGKLRINGKISGVIEGIKLDVGGGDHGHHHGDDNHHGDQAETHHDELIEFLKEQQWGVPFATAFAEFGKVTSSLRVPGRVAPKPGANAEINASLSGELKAPKTGFALPGSLIKKGQILAYLLPNPASQRSIADARRGLSQAQGRAAAASKALARAQALLRDKALPKARLEAAEREQVMAQKSLSQSAELVARYGNSNQLALRSPIDGTLIDSHAQLGAAVDAGTMVFRVVDMNALWIVAQVPEHQAGQLGENGAAEYRVSGDKNWKTLRMDGENPSASLVSIGQSVHPETRSVEVIYTIRDAKNIRLGALLEVGLAAGPAYRGVIIDSSALIDSDGRSVVFVQSDGEHFEERLVRTGKRSADRVAILQGLAVHERVVTKGAHLIRLAERASGEQMGGHIH